VPHALFGSGDLDQDDPFSNTNLHLDQAWPTSMASQSSTEDYDRLSLDED
jgi:hypothetical protein